MVRTESLKNAYSKRPDTRVRCVDAPVRPPNPLVKPAHLEYQDEDEEGDDGPRRGADGRIFRSAKRPRKGKVIVEDGGGKRVKGAAEDVISLATTDPWVYYCDISLRNFADPCVCSVLYQFGPNPRCFCRTQICGQDIGRLELNALQPLVEAPSYWEVGLARRDVKSPIRRRTENPRKRQRDDFPPASVLA